MNDAKLSKQVHPTLQLPLKGGNGGEPAQLPEQEPGGDITDAVSNVFTKVTIFTPLYQPFKVMRFLIQCGYEPVRPYSLLTRGFMDFLMDRPQSTYTYLPGIIGYSKGLFRIYGWGVFCAGLGPSMLECLLDMLNEAFCTQILDRVFLDVFNFKRIEERHPYFDSKQVLILGLKSSMLNFIILLVSYPLFVAGNVSILRSIKGEASVWIWTILREVWSETGVAGLYSGFLAILAYRVVSGWCEEVCVELMRLLMQRLNEDNANETNRNANYTIAHFVITSITYPLYQTGTIMSINKCPAKIMGNKLPLIPVFSSWLACFKHLYTTGTWFRGSAVIQRRLLYTES